MQDLKDVTNNVHYENYRYKKLAHVSAADGKADTGDRLVRTLSTYKYYVYGRNFVVMMIKLLTRLTYKP